MGMHPVINVKRTLYFILNVSLTLIITNDFVEYFFDCGTIT